DLVYQSQHIDFEHHDMNLRAFGNNRQPIAFTPDGDELAGQLKQAQELYEVGLDVAQAGQVLQLVFGKAQVAQGIQLCIDLVLQLGQGVDGFVPAHEAILGIVGGVVV